MPICCAGVLRSHTAEAMEEASRSAEASYGIEEKDRFYRIAGNIGDGAIEGPFGVSMGQRPLPGLDIGALDDLHAVDKGGNQADGHERRKGGFVFQYQTSACEVKAAFAWGVGKTIFRCFAKALGIKAMSPVAPSSESTRMVIYESSRIARAFLNNVAIAAAGFLLRLQESIQEARLTSAKQGHTATPSCGLFTKKARQWRAAGRRLLDPAMLVFVHVRFDVRRDGILSFAIPTQRHSLSGLTKVSMAAAVDEVIMRKRAAVAGLLGACRVYQTLMNFLSGCLWPRTNIPSKHSIKAFVAEIAFQTAGRELPTTVPRVLEILFHRRYKKANLGLATATTHPFAEPTRGATAPERRTREQPAESRLRTCQLVETGLLRARSWASREQKFFRSRVCFWDSEDMPRKFLSAGHFI